MKLKLPLFPNHFLLLKSSPLDSNKAIADGFTSISKDIANIWDYVNYNKTILDDIPDLPSRKTYGLNGTNIFVYSATGNSGLPFLDTTFYNEDEERPQTVYEALVTVAQTTGIAPATVSKMGISKLSTSAVNPNSPIVVGDNDNRLLTFIQKSDLTDGGDTTLHKHDDRYYTEDEIDNIINNLSISSNLADLNDVELTSLQTNQIIKYNGSNWINADLTVVAAFADLTDVTLTTPIANQGLTYNGTDWVNTTIPLLDRQNSFSKAQITSIATLTRAATTSWDLDNAQTAKVTLDGSITTLNASNIRAGGQYMLAVVQDAIGGRTVGWGTMFRFPDDVPIGVASAPNKMTIIYGFSHDGTKLYVTDIQVYST